MPWHIISFSPHNYLLTLILVLPHLTKLRPQKLGHMLKITQQVTDGPGIQTQVF